MDAEKIPYVDLALQDAPIRDELLSAVERVLRHGRFILGPEVEEFENQFARYCGTDHAVAVSSGTSALSLSLEALGIGPGDEVIVPPNSFVASASSIALVGARPVFVDVREDFNIDPDLVERAITPKTRAIMPVHLTGRPADMDRIMGIAEGRGLHVVEDCAQAVGARYHDRPVGSFGITGCFSLHPLKTLNAAGDGGIIVTNDAGLADTLRKARNHGLRSRDECEFWSPNSRLDTIQAAMLNVKMTYIDHWTEARRGHAAFYQEHLQGIVQVPVDKPYEYAAYHTFVIMAEERDALQRFLWERGVETKIHYPVPIHRQEAARRSGWGDVLMPVAESQCRRILSLPIYHALSETQRERVVESIKQCYKAGV